MVVGLTICLVSAGLSPSPIAAAERGPFPISAMVKVAVAGADEKLVVPAIVDERVELLSIIFRLVGAPEYRQTSNAVTYAKGADEYFGPFKDHEAIKLARTLRQKRGIGYDAVASFSIHIKGGPKLEPFVPFDSKGIELEKRWDASSASEFLAALQKFADDSKAFEFFERHRELYAQSADRLAHEVAKRPYRAWLDEFFGAKSGAKFVAVVGMLNGGANYSVKRRDDTGQEEIVTIIGAGSFDSQGVATFGTSSSGLVAHELCHAYCNPLVDKFAEWLTPSGQKIFPHRAEYMRQQAYPTAKIMLYESLVRASTHRFLVRHGTKREAAQQLFDEVGRGFFWTPELSKLLAEYEGSRNQYKTLEAFMPRIIEFFDRLAGNMDVEMSRFPRIVTTSPANRAKEVDPTLRELRIEFDRPMKRNQHSLVGRPNDVPKFPSTGGFSADGKVFIQPIQLEPNRTYRFSVNGLYHRGFASVEGLPLDYVEFTFTTGRAK